MINELVDKYAQSPLTVGEALSLENDWGFARPAGGVSGRCVLSLWKRTDWTPLPCRGAAGAYHWYRSVGAAAGGDIIERTHRALIGLRELYERKTSIKVNFDIFA